MELFVVNRHEETTQNGPSQDNNQKTKLDKVLSRIERNKRARARQKELKQKQLEGKNETLKARAKKREIKSKIIPVPENNLSEFIPQEEPPKPKKLKTEDVKVNVEGFTVLGQENFAKKQKVKRVLPKWLSNPTVISVNLQNLNTKVSDITLLSHSLRKQLKKNGIKYFFPVQAAVIPWLLENNSHNDVVFPRDICVSAPAGSGKTLAFVLPVIQALNRAEIRKIRALVILPTQDLAVQVFKVFKTYSAGTNIEVGLCTGQNSFEIEQKQLGYFNEAFGYISKLDVLVCTAGRLVDHLKMTQGFSLQALEFLIIDEADRVLETVQNDWLYHLEKHIYDENQTNRVLNLQTLRNRRPPQKLLFSATLSQDPEKLQVLSLFQPKLFTSIVEGESTTQEANGDAFIGKYTTPNELEEQFMLVNKDLKPLFLYKFVKNNSIKRSIIFTHSVETAHRLTILLKSLFQNELNIEEISSKLTGQQRANLIDNFSKGKIDLLVCTDSLARGIDLPQVECVVSYSAPKYIKTYIHRAGRTARAGEKGLTITLLHKTQLNQFEKLLKLANKTCVKEVKLDETELEELAELYQESLAELKNVVEKEEQLDLEKTIQAKRLGKKKPRKKKT